MPKIKIAHIITHLELGGAQKTTLSLLKHINKQDYEAHLITSPEGLLVEDARSIPRLRLFFVPALIREINPIKDIISFWQILRYLKKEGISLVHTHSPKAGIIGRWAARFAGVKLIFHTVHGWPFYIEANTSVRFFYKLLEKATSWLTTRLVVVSNADLEAGLKYVNKNITKYVKVYYGIESKDFLHTNRPEKDKDSYPLNSLNIKKKACIVGGIFCFKPQKAPLDFIKTAKTVIDKSGNVEFLSIGDGFLRPAAERFSLESGLNGRIRFLGWQRDMPALLSIIDILLLTSRWEGLPVVFLEAMASGVPVVATNVGGASEVIKDGINGFLEEKGACERLADDILFLVNNPDKRREFSERARGAFRQEFDISYMTARIQNLYEQSMKIRARHNLNKRRYRE